MNIRILLVFVAVVAIAAIAVRLVPSLPNFTPIGALALFAGAYLARYSKWWLLSPLLVMAISDYFIGTYDWRLMAAVYGSFLLYGVIGMLIARKINFATVLGGAVGGAVLFYLITNAAVWALSSWYPPTLEGLMMSYTMAIPFFRFTLLGDLVFSAALFGSYAALYMFVFQRVDATAKEEGVDFGSRRPYKII